jgi:DNA processing protein
MDELTCWLRLLGAPGVGRVGARRLVQRHGSLEAAAAAAQPPTDLVSQALERSRRWLEGGQLRSLLMLGDVDYPPLLLNSPDPPLLLFLEGRREQLAQLPAMAVVGSRHPTPQGRETARGLAAELAGAGLAVVSGLAIGIDGEAHRGALTRGTSWAVLGSGLDVIHPRAHRELAASLIERGLLISEHVPGTQPLPQHFPVRNRIIAGLCQGCLVVEAAEQSGSLITARLAGEAGRDVFAVPGSIRSPQSRGCHLLIQQGAQLVQELADLLPGVAAPTLKTEGPQGVEDPLLAALGWEPSSLEALQARTGWRTEALLARLLELELEGRLRRVAGGRFERTAAA